MFVNPYGGKKSASKIFVDDVKPLLEDANIVYEVQGNWPFMGFWIIQMGLLFSRLLTGLILKLAETKHQGHAKEIAQTLDLSKYDGIVCVSGDGILVEVSWKCLLLSFLGLICIRY